jgi:uncharacterized protein (TIGR02246 family)
MIRTLLFAAALLSAHGALAQEKKMPTTDEAAIRALGDSFTAAWSKGDVDALVALYADDGVRVGAAGDRQQGRGELKAAFAKLFTGPFAGATVVGGPQTIRFVTPEVALKSGPFEIVPAGGKPPIKLYAVDVLVKRGGAWKILESHPKILPPPPAGPASMPAR